MKIGILTFNKSINYGSVLQAWALQYLLLNNGYSVEIIDYEPEAYHKLYDVFIKPYSLKSVITNIKRLPLSPFLKLQKIKFDVFCNKFLNLSLEKYQASTRLGGINQFYDCIICGSDQIWNVRADDCDAAFFLPEVSGLIKIAYGVSINDTDFTEKRYSSYLDKWILDFNYISCREISGARKIQEYIRDEKNVDVVLDPTLFCSREDFMKIASRPFIKSKYVFLYSAWYNEQIAEAGRIVSNKLGIPIYTILMGKSCSRLIQFTQNGIRCILMHTGPGDFVRLLADASFVLTDSFHGTAFSLIMERPFVSINYIIQAKKEKNDERIVNILDTLKLRNQYLTIEQLKFYDFETKIDYMHITQERIKLANNSRQWLLNAIKNKVDCNE